MGRVPLTESNILSFGLEARIASGNAGYLESHGRIRAALSRRDREHEWKHGSYSQEVAERVYRMDDDRIQS